MEEPNKKAEYGYSDPPSNDLFTLIATTFTFRHRTHNEYMALIKFAILLDFAAVGVNLYGAVTIMPIPFRLIEAVLCVIAALILINNIIMSIIVIHKPTTRLCIAIWCLAILVVIISIVQILLNEVYTLVYDRESKTHAICFTIEILAFSLQFFPVIISYRFWEYLTYDHDYRDSGSNSSRASNYSRDNNQSVDSIKTPLHNDDGLKSTV